MAIKRKLDPIAGPTVQHWNENDVVRELKNAGINVPADFSNQLLAKHNERSRDVFSVKSEQIKGVLKACNYWKPFLSSHDDWNALVLREVLSMVSIHTSVINLRYLKYPLNEQPSDDRAETCVFHSGEVRARYF